MWVIDTYDTSYRRVPEHKGSWFSFMVGVLIILLVGAAAISYVQYQTFIPTSTNLSEGYSKLYAFVADQQEIAAVRIPILLRRLPGDVSHAVKNGQRLFTTTSRSVGSTLSLNFSGLADTISWNILSLKQTVLRVIPAK